MRLRSSKYSAKRTEVDGVVFHSQKEARRYQELKLLLAAGAIECLALQPEFDLDVIGGQVKDVRYRIGGYKADFQYIDRRTGKRIVEDVKGFKTPLYKWKKKHVEAQYGITILET
jgi:hypothetical protein